MPDFSLYNDTGDLKVSLQPCGKVSMLTSHQRGLINWFHDFIFTKTLEFKLCSLTKNGCRVVILNASESWQRTVPAACIINFGEMELLKDKVSESDGKFSNDIDLLDSVVMQGYLRNGTQYLVSSTVGNAWSTFPDQHVAKTYMEYFEDKYTMKIRNPYDPLVEVVPHKRKIDCRRRIEPTRKQTGTIHLIPEMLDFRSSPLSLTLRAGFVPVILYRIDSLVSVIQLRDTISTELVESIPYAMPESPRKRLRGISSKKSSADAPTELEKYFCPFNSSKTVPLFQLLEAVTCANSGDDFNLERLEMLGDSFLKVAVSIHVYWHKDHKDEGKLTKYRTRQISNKNLFNLATKKGLDEYIKYSTFAKDTWLPPGFTRVLSDDDNDDVIRCDVTGDVVTQKIPDKSVADSMEALIGAHLIHCGYIGTMGFMDWLGLDVFCKEVNDDEERTNGNRRKSPTPPNHSKYANYPQPTLEIPDSEDTGRYQENLSRQTKEMASFEQSIGYSFKNKVCNLLSIFN